jgi:glycosyltransferase involved in cell wall biosynthesis
MDADKQTEPDVSELPLVSIITPVLNCQDVLENHIRMVGSQTYKNREHLIIDGGSSDQTKEILKSESSRLAYWISEPDRGIYDAMNKGIDAASGQWLIFCGADDVFSGPEILEQVFVRHQIDKRARLICGNVIRGDGRKIRSRFSRRLYYKNTLPHQGVFYRRDIFDHYRYGGLKTSSGPYDFKVSGDYHLNFRLYATGAVHQPVDCTIMRCGHGRSMTGGFVGYREEIMIRHLFIGRFNSIIFDFLTLLRYLRRRGVIHHFYGNHTHPG